MSKKIIPGDKLIVYGSDSHSKPFLAEMVDYDPHGKMYLVVEESKLSEIGNTNVPKITYDNVPEELESFMVTEVLGGNEKLKESFWVHANVVRKINMEPLSFIQKLVAKLFDI